MTQNPPPFYTLSFGVIRAAIWRNESDDSTKNPWFNVTFERGYRDDAGKWNSSASFGRDDLLTLAKLAEECFSYLHTQQEIERSRSRAHGDNGKQHSR